jgi:hypothetical protein
MGSTVRRVADIAGSWDWDHDPWGTGLGLQFAICHVLDAIGGYGDALARWEYSRGAMPVRSIVALANDDEELEDYETSALASAILDGYLTPDDLVHAGNVLARYTALARLAGRDY